MSMSPPADTMLPFFSYGIFQPGELGFLQIQGQADRWTPDSVSGCLRIRDGLPILDRTGRNSVEGFLLEFAPGREDDAYTKIADMEPQRQYYWKRLTCSDSGVEANCLVGKRPLRGSVAWSEPKWSGRDDPLFKEALAIVGNTIRRRQGRPDSIYGMFRIEMAYMLLWSSIERYVSLRYNLAGEQAEKKVERIVEEESFRDALTLVRPHWSSVCRADDPDTRETLDPEDPVKTIQYYYQLRCNLVHRGKSDWQDNERLKTALEELFAIYKIALTSAFRESESNGPR